MPRQVMARPPGYRYGSWLVLHGSGAHLVGFSTASWLSRDSTDTVGLWSRCQLSHCDRLWVEHVPGELPRWDFGGLWPS